MSSTLGHHGITFVMWEACFNCSFNASLFPTLELVLRSQAREG